MEWIALTFSYSVASAGVAEVPLPVFLITGLIGRFADVPAMVSPSRAISEAAASACQTSDHAHRPMEVGVS